MTFVALTKTQTGIEMRPRVWVALVADGGDGFELVGATSDRSLVKRVAEHLEHELLPQEPIAKSLAMGRRLALKQLRQPALSVLKGMNS